MTGRSDEPGAPARETSAPTDWLEMLDKRIGGLKVRESWQEDPVVAFQRCRRFVMARFPQLLRPFSDEALSRELSRGEERIGQLRHAKRILRDLNGAQRKQLAGLILDIEEALKFYSRHDQVSKVLRQLADEAPRRTRMLSRKVKAVRDKLKELMDYAAGLHAALGLEHVRVAKRCLETLKKVKTNRFAGKYFRLQKIEYAPLEQPRQLGIVQLYWFFRSECKRRGAESEVRVALLVNEFLVVVNAPLNRSNGRPLRFVPHYRIDESMGSSAVRLAVTRFRPRTLE